MVYFIVELAASFVESYLFYAVVCLLFKKEEKFWLRLLASIGTAILVVYLNSFSYFSYYTAVVVLGIWMLIIIFGWRISIGYSLAIALFYALCIQIIDCIVLSIGAVIMRQPDFMQKVLVEGKLRVIFLILCKATFILVYLIVREILNRCKFEQKKQLLFISIAGIGSAIYLSEQMLLQINVDIALSWIFLMIIVVLLIIVVYFYLRQQREKDAKEFADMRNELLEDNYNNLKSVYEANAKLFHDFKHHIRVINELAETNQYDELKEYIAGFDLKNQRKGNIQYTEDNVVNIVLNEKITKAEEKNIKVETKIAYPAKSGVLSKDMTTIIANLFDNAVESCDKAAEGQKKWLRITVVKVNQMLMIKLENSCYNEPKAKGKYFLSQKEPRQFHGWGLRSIDTTAQKYNGTILCDYFPEKQLFQSVVNLCLDSIEE